MWCADWHPKGEIIASCGGDKEVKVWRKLSTADPTSEDSSWMLMATLSGDHQRTVRCVRGGVGVEQWVGALYLDYVQCCLAHLLPQLMIAHGEHTWAM